MTEEDVSMLIDTTASNPMYQNSIRFCDVKDGLEFICVDTTKMGYIHEGKFSGNPVVTRDQFHNNMIHVYYVHHLYSNGPIPVKEHSSKLGITKDGNGVWKEVFSIINCAQNRKELALWLSRNDIPRKEEFINFLANKYPEALDIIKV